MGGTIFYSDPSKPNTKIAAATAFLSYLKQQKFKVKLNVKQVIKAFKTGKKEFAIWSKSHQFADIHPYDLLTKFYFKTAFKHLDQIKLRAVSNQLINVWKSHGSAVIRPEAKKVLKKLAKHYQLGVISNTDSLDYVVIRLIDNNIYHYFYPGCIFLSCLAQVRKPHPTIFEVALNALKVKPRECVYVGDQIKKDVQGAKNAKLRACIRIESDEKNNDHKNDTKYVINNLTQILPIIKNLNK